MEKTKETEVNKMWNPGWDNGPEKRKKTLMKIL